MASPATFGEALKVSQSDALNNFNISKSQKDLSYKAFVVAQEQGILVEAWLPETIGMDVNATYEAPFVQGLGALSGMEGLSSLARFLGMSLTTQSLTAQIWQGGAFIEFTIPFVFQAETSAAQDVILPIQRLLSLMMPKDPTGGGLLEAPGPRIDLTKLAANAREELKGAGSAVVNEITGLAKSIDTSNGIVSTAIDAANKGQASLNKAAKSVSTALVNSVVNNISLHLGQFLYFPSVVITDVSPTFDTIIAGDKNPMRATVNVGFRTFYLPTSKDIAIMFPATEGLALENKSAVGGGDRGTRGWK